MSKLSLLAFLQELLLKMSKPAINLHFSIFWESNSKKKGIQNIVTKTPEKNLILFKFAH